MSTTIDIYNKEGKKTGSQELSSDIFELPVNKSLIYQVYTVKLANRRIHYAHTKTRADVRGGGRKPWRQKGTGRARHGSRRSPIWVGGGVTFGPRNDKVFGKKVNKKMNQKAIASVLSNKLREGTLFVVDSLEFSEAKTKSAANTLKALKINDASGVVYGTKEDKNFKRVFSNIPKVDPHSISRLNIVDILEKKNVVFSKAAIEEFVGRYEKDGAKPEKAQDKKSAKKTAKKKEPVKK